VVGPGTHRCLGEGKEQTAQGVRRSRDSATRKAPQVATSAARAEPKSEPRRAGRS
jgi:hypothetical protein